MKSIMEQASSIIKAIEKAWDRAEKPKEFSIKIFEQEEKNFFGMTTKPAKIGIFFEDKIATTQEKPAVKISSSHKASESKSTDTSPEKSKEQQQQKPYPAPKSMQAPQVKTQPRTEKSKPEPSLSALQPSKVEQKIKQQRSAQTQDQPKTDQPRRAPATWNDEMINTTQSWLKETLSLMGMTNITFAQEVAGKNLKLTFNEPLIADIMHEKMLFRSFAHLIMASLRNQYKQEIKDLKVILIRPE